MNDFKIVIKLNRSDTPIIIPNSEYLEIVDWGIDVDSEIFWCYVHDKENQTVYLYFPIKNIDYIASNVPVNIN